MSDRLSQVKELKIDDDCTLFLKHRRALSYLDYINGVPSVSGIAVMKHSATGAEKVFTVDIRITALGKEFSSNSSTELRGSQTPEGMTRPNDLRLLPQTFLEITDTVVGELEIVVQCEGDTLASFSETIDLLPMGVWLWQDLLSNQDLVNLASFSVPLYESVSSTLRKAGSILASKGEDPNIKSYQWDGPVPAEIARAKKLAEIGAIYEAAQSLGIQYANPATTYDQDSQRIRTPNEIVSHGTATCLDSALFLSSLLEGAGYRPILAVVPGHAFVGAWLIENEPLPDLICQLSDVINLVGDQFVLFETTTICTPGTKNFEAAIAEASAQIDMAEMQRLDRSIDTNLLDAHKQYRLIDVTPLKLFGLAKPIPERIVSASGEVTIVEAVFKPVFGDIAERGANSNPAAALLQDDSPARVKVWKEGLLDLTFRNPLLEMKRGTQLKKGGVRIFAPTAGSGVIEDILQERDASGKPRSLRVKPAPVIPIDENKGYRTFSTVRGRVDDPAAQEMVDASFGAYKHLHTDLQPEEFAKRFKKLVREARTSYEETGTNSLYITFGSLTWQRASAWGAATDTMATSPLLLLPVSITALNRGQEFEITLDETNSITTNETLALKLLKDYGIDLPQLRVPELDNSGFDVPGLVKHVEDVLAKTKHNDWRVDADCTIGFYDFSTYHQWKDLNDNWRKLKDAPLVEHLIDKSHTEFNDPMANKKAVLDLDLETSRVPIETDESQIRAIARSLNGESFVIQGPPGTGKSQTITNLLARNMQEGRRVLFVCEKAAALEVVKRRLDTVGLGEFVLDLHGTKTKPSEVRSRLMVALELSPYGDKTGLEAAKYDHDQALNALNKYPERLHNADNAFEISVYEARDKYLAIESDAVLDLDAGLLRTMHAKEKKAFSNTLLSIGDVGEIAGTSIANAWSLANIPVHLLTSVIKDGLRVAMQNLAENLAAVRHNTDANGIFDQLKSLEETALLSSLSSETLPPASNIELILTPLGASKIAEAQAALGDFLSNPERQLVSESLLDAPIEELRAKAQGVVESGFFGRKKKLAGFIFAISPYLVDANQVTKDNLGEVLNKFLSVHLAATRALEVIKGLQGVISIPAGFSPQRERDREWLTAEITKVANVRAFVESVNEASRGPVTRMLSRGESQVISVLANLGSQLTAIFRLVEADDESLTRWKNGRSLFEAISQSASRWVSDCLDADFSLLTKWARLVDLLEPLKQAGQLRARTEVLDGQIAFAEVPRAFDRAYFELVYKKLLEENDLGNFEGRSFDSSVKQFGEASHRLRGFTRSTMAEEILKVRTFDGKAGVGQAGSLRAELNKRTNQLPVRQLMKRYWGTITEITPCVAASPDSVARFLDVDFAKFDLVVFDEASQIRVATAIGALGRAKSAIIVGDSKQMPPTSFFSAGYETEEDLFDTNSELPVQDEESILSEAVRSQIPSTMLTWHYRSQDEALIAFSNKEYYDGRLSSFPSPSESLDSKGVSWRPITNGQYFRQIKTANIDAARDAMKLSPSDKKRLRNIGNSELYNTNPIEALAIVDDVIRRFNDPALAKLSMGIVTMNEQQCKLISALLDDVQNEDLQNARKSDVTEDYLFVRALEKVQGDERDVIFMSIGFSKDASGKVPMNFGPLSRKGGERRLNVAITRARVQVAVFCSFEPSDLAIKETTADGMKHLQQYMEMAKNGPRAIGLSNGGPGRPADRHRADIARELEKHGWVVTQDVGLSGFRIDLAVASKNDPNKRLLGIMLDGRDWYRRQTASDRDVLPVVFLQKNMGWPRIERVWLPTWLRDRSGEIERISNALAAAKENDSHENLSFDLPKLANISHQKASEAHGVSEGIQSLRGQVGVDISDIPKFQELRISIIGQKSDLNEVAHPGVKEAVRSLATKLISVEGPTSPSRFATVVAKSFGLTSVKSEKAATINALPLANVNSRDSEGFLYPDWVKPDQFTTWSRQDVGEGRDLQDISLHEISNCMRDLCARVHGMAEAELFKQTSLAFGFLRVGANANDRLSKALELGYSRSILVSDAGLVLAN